MKPYFKTIWKQTSLQSKIYSLPLAKLIKPPISVSICSEVMFTKLHFLRPFGWLFLFSADSPACLYLKLQYPKLAAEEASVISNQDSYVLCLLCNTPDHKMQTHIYLFSQQHHIVSSLFFPYDLVCFPAPALLSYSKQHKSRVDNAFFTFHFLIWGKGAVYFHT